MAQKTVSASGQAISPAKPRRSNLAAAALHSALPASAAARKAS